MNYGFLFLLLLLLFFLLYSLLRVLGKDIGYGSSAQDRQVVRNSLANMKQKHDKPKLKALIDPAKTQNMSNNDANTIIRLGELSLSTEDKAALKQLDQNEAFSSQVLIDGFYVFGQKLLEDYLQSQQPAQDLNQQPAQHQIACKQAVQELWQKHFASLFELAKDIDLLAFKLTSLQNIKADKKKLSFVAGTRCIFSLYQRNQQDDIFAQTQKSFDFNWHVSIDLTCWKSNKWQIDDLSIVAV